MLSLRDELQGGLPGASGQGSGGAPTTRRFSRDCGIGFGGGARKIEFGDGVDTIHEDVGIMGRAADDKMGKEDDGMHISKRAGARA
eukprot:15458897-Alexandrium_andersonii.AAC.1